MVATKTKPSAITAAAGHLEVMAEQRREVLAAAEEAAMQLARGGELTPEMDTIFKAVGWDGVPTLATTQLGRQVSRLRSVLAEQEKAGTSQDREAAEKRLEAARQRLAARDDEIRQAIRELESELQALTGDLQAAQAEVTARNSAVRQLRLLAPDAVKHSIVLDRASIDRKYNRRIGELQQIVSKPESCAALEYKPQMQPHVCRVNGREDLIRRDARKNEVVLPSDWRVFQDWLQEQADAAEEELRPLIAERDAELAAAGEKFDYYLR